MKPNVKVLYYIMKLNGIVPFRVNLQQGIVERTSGSFCHFLIFGAFLQLVAMISCILLLHALSQINENNMRAFVVMMEIAAQSFKTLMMFALGALYHKDLIQLINESIAFRKVATMSQSFFDVVLTSQYATRFFCFSLQVVIMLFAFGTVSYMPGNVMYNTVWAIAMYNNFNAALVSSTFVYGGLVTCSRLLRMLNDNLELGLLMKNEQNMDGTEISTETAIFHLDRFTIFFTKFTSITNTFYRIYGFHILLVLAVSVTFTLSELFIGIDLMYRQLLSTETFTGVVLIGLIIDMFTTLIMNVCELYFIITGAHSIRKEIERSFQICYKYATKQHTDKKLRESVDDFHIAIRTRRPYLIVFGLFEIEKSLFLSISATIVSFLTILIQFQLECVNCENLDEVFVFEQSGNKTNE